MTVKWLIKISMSITLDNSHALDDNVTVEDKKNRHKVNRRSLMIKH
jgi:hypothetical protein